VLDLEVLRDESCSYSDITRRRLPSRLEERSAAFFLLAHLSFGRLLTLATPALKG
jgi:hypothetical protein